MSAELGTSDSAESNASSALLLCVLRFVRETGHPNMESTTAPKAPRLRRKVCMESQSPSLRSNAPTRSSSWPRLVVRIPALAVTRYRLSYRGRRPGVPARRCYGAGELSALLCWRALRSSCSQQNSIYSNRSGGIGSQLSVPNQPAAGESRPAWSEWSALS